MLFRFTLEKGSKKHHCWDCNKRRFVRYIDTLSGKYLPEEYGRCDRESKCGYHLNPYLNGYAKQIKKEETGESNPGFMPRRYQHKRPFNRKPDPVFIPTNLLNQTLNAERYGSNSFVQNLLLHVPFPFELGDLEKVIALYYLGTISKGYRAGATTFPFIDVEGNVRTIQVKQFDKANHTISTDFLHSILERYFKSTQLDTPTWLQAYSEQDKRVSCLFGEHLLSRYPRNPIALVEAPKTAIYASLYFGFPQDPEDLVWLAVYNKSSFTFDKLKVLKGRDVLVFPDLSEDGGTYSEWYNKAQKYKEQLPGTQFIFSDLLEQIAPHADRARGNDLADYLIRLDWRQFRNTAITNKTPKPKNINTESCENCEKCDPVIETKNFPTPKQLKKPPMPVLQESIEDLAFYFEGTLQFPSTIRLNDCSEIIDVPRFIDSHLSLIRNAHGDKAALPYVDRLIHVKRILSSPNMLEGGLNLKG